MLHVGLDFWISVRFHNTKAIIFGLSITRKKMIPKPQESNTCHNWSFDNQAMSTVCATSGRQWGSKTMVQHSHWATIV